MQPFQSPSNYIDRDAQKQLLQQVVVRARTESLAIAVYFKADGGQGKTHLFRQLPQILDEKITKGETEHVQPCIVPPIDLYNFETRNPTIIEQRIVIGLKQVTGNEWFRLPVEMVDELFVPYSRALNSYRQARDFGSSKAASDARTALRKAFIDCVNRVTAQRPVVIGFDTLEAIFNSPVPDEAFINLAGAGTGTDLVLEWMQQVLPQLQHTVVLLCGRPMKQEPKLLASLRKVLLPEYVQKLEDLTNPDDVRAYLEYYTLDPRKDELLYIQRITENRPLLLTCYAEIHREEGGLALLSRPPVFDGREQFEDWMVEQILNPFHEPTTQDASQNTLIRSLYFLVYARRGIRKEQIRELFIRQREPYAEDVINQLQHLAIIKSDGDRLFLHDEIFRLIDESRYADDFGAKEDTLTYLKEISAAEVKEAVELSSKLRAMTDHLYYELLLDLQKGYRVYSVYEDILIRQRTLNSALVLCGAFWTVLEPLKERIAEYNLTLGEIYRDEQVRRLKYLRASDRAREGAELAQGLYKQYVQQGLVSADNQTVAVVWPQDAYLFVDFNIERAMNIAQTRSSEYTELANRIFENVIELLEDPRVMEDTSSFLYLRRNYFLGVACTLRSYLYDQERQFDLAKEYGRKARRAYTAYAREPVADGRPARDLLYDDILVDVAQAANNLAYNLALSGELEEARLRSKEIVEEYVPKVSPYRAALFLNTYGFILLLSGRYLEAREPIEMALKAAQASGVRRVLGLTARSVAHLGRIEMISKQQPNPELEQAYLQAKELLDEDKVALVDVIYDLAGYQRDIGALYRARSEINKALVYEGKALASLEECYNLSTSYMQRADIIESTAAVYNNMEDYTNAEIKLDEAEQLMHHKMARYGQVVSGKIALQRGVMAILHRQDYTTGLRAFVVSLARAYTYGDVHRDQGIFERLIERWLRLVPDESLETFRGELDSTSMIAAAELPYQQPDQTQWEAALRKSLNFIQRRISVRLDLA